MATRKKLIVVGTLAVGVLAIALALVLSTDFASPKLGKAALEQASKATGMKLSAAGFRLNLLRGLTLEEVEAFWRFPGGRLEARIDEILFEHRLMPLLSGKVVIERVVVRRPSLKLVEARNKPASKQNSNRRRDRSPEPQRRRDPTAVEAQRLVLEISELRLEDGAYSSAGKGGGSFPSVRGVDCLLHNIDIQTGALTLLHGLSADGELHVKEIALESSLVQGFAARLEASGGGLALDDLSLTTHGSPFLGSMTWDFNTIPFKYTLRLKGGPLDVDTLTGSSGSPGGFGAAFLELEAEGFGSDSRNIKGKGKLRLESGTLPPIPVLSLLEEALGRSGLVGSAYRETDLAFRLEKNHLLLEPFQLEAGNVGFELSGSVDLDGPLDLRVVLQSEQGQIAAPFQVSGTMEEPVVRYDREK
jgi:hypothetical protein